MRISTFNTIAAFCFTILLFGNSNLFAQATRDVDIHRDPMIMKPGYKAPQGDAAQASVITIDDYDNFKLGVDFAECSVASNPLDPKQMYAVWNIIGGAGGKGYRTENGYDWIASNPSWTGMAGDVVVVSDSSGRLIYENMYGSISGSKVVTSTDFGLTWDPVAIAIGGNDKNWIAADQTGGAYSNYIYTTMTNNGSGAHARSIDHGATFANTQSFNTQELPGMMVAVGPSDAMQGAPVYVVTNSGSSFASTFTFYKSIDGGMTYSLKSSQNFSNYVGSDVGGRNSVQNMRTRPYPFISVDNSTGPNRGRLYLVYASNFPAGNGNKPDIFCRYSDNGGANWSSAVTVNDDVNTVNNNNWFPAVWNDKSTGKLYISWMDTRDCPSGDSAMMYATYTLDGETFAPNQAVSNKKMKINCSTCGGGGTPRYQGDYNGIASNPTGAIIAWTDFREGSFGSYVGYFPDYALRATPVLASTEPIATFYANVPSVKLYTDTVFVSASVNAPANLFTITYPEGNKLWQYPGQLPINITSNGATAGDYIVTITTAGSNGLPVHKRVVTVRVPALVAPIANFSADNTIICGGQTVNFTDLSTGPASSWAWSFPGGTPATSTDKNPTGIVYSTAGVYSVTLVATNAAGTNTMVKTDFITVKAVPLAPTATSQAVCSGLPVPPLTATGAGLLWYSAGTQVGTGPSFVTGQTAAGVYQYTVTQSANGCESPPTSVSLTINALPVVNLAKLDSVCISHAAFNLSGGTPAGGTYSGTGVTNGLVFTPSIAGAGNHVITYTFTNGNGCTNTSQQPIKVNALPIVSLTHISPLCLNASPIKLSGSPAGGSFTGPGVSADTLYPAVAGAGSKTITYSYTNSATGCPGSASQVVTINTLPVVAIYDSTVCGYRKVIYDATISNPGSYLWYPGGATTAKFQVDTVGKGLGAFTYRIRVTDGNGCIASDSAKVTFFNCTGIEEMADSRIIELYPNPNNGQFAIRSQSLPTGKYDLSIYDVRGKLVFTESSLNIGSDFLHTLNLGTLGNGVYMLRLSNNNNVGYSKRFIISK